MSTDQITAGDLITIADAAEYAGKSTRTIRRWASQGMLPIYRLGPQSIMVNPADIDALVTRVV